MPDELQIDDEGKLTVSPDGKLATGTNCCCGTIGFDETAWGVTSCFPSSAVIINLASDISRISECRLVFAGNKATCAQAVRFASGDWPAVKSYIEDGGRLWLQAEYQGCMTDVANLASFLSALGSAITWLGGSHDSNCATDGSRDCIAGAANIAQGVTFRMALTAELSGGTNVWQSPSGRNMVQVEQLGSGFLFVSGDSNLFDGCGYDNCSFAQRLLNYADDQIL